MRVFLKLSSLYLQLLFGQKIKKKGITGSNNGKEDNA